MNDSELYGRTLRVNLAKPMKIKEGSSRPVWASDEWLQKYAGQHPKVFFSTFLPPLLLV
jgi:peptidyl-prolyl isomerase E (cyclophilin E)